MDKKEFHENMISDENLSEVTGGASFRKRGDDNFYSGEKPAFQPGDETWIIYDRGFFRKSAVCGCQVVSINPDKAGAVFPEFLYTVRIISAPSYALETDPTLIGQLVTDVYESAISIKIAD